MTVRSQDLAGIEKLRSQDIAGDAATGFAHWSEHLPRRAHLLFVHVDEAGSDLVLLEDSR